MSLRNLFGFFERGQTSAAPNRNSTKPSEADGDIDWLWPPDDIHDVQAWDNHWHQQVEHGLGPQLFDMFCHDGDLVDAMRR